VVCSPSTYRPQSGQSIRSWCHLGSHYAVIFTDHNYQPPSLKLDQPSSSSLYMSKWRMFKILDTLHPTATGIDHLPAWFLRLAAPIFYKPLTRLFNLSISTSTVAQQWKSASIRPLPNVSAHAGHSDFTPISITPVLSRIIERTIVQHFLYSILHPPSLSLTSLHYAHQDPPLQPSFPYCIASPLC